MHNPAAKSNKLLERQLAITGPEDGSGSESQDMTGTALRKLHLLKIEGLIYLYMQEPQLWCPMMRLYRDHSDADPAKLPSVHLMSTWPTIICGWDQR